MQIKEINFASGKRWKKNAQENSAHEKTNVLSRIEIYEFHK